MQTLDLLDKAQATGRSLREWSVALGLHANALARAKGQGGLSPAVAAVLAAELGEDPRAWMAAAVLESERTTPLGKKLERLTKRLATALGLALLIGPGLMRPDQAQAQPATAERARVCILCQL